MTLPERGRELEDEFIRRMTDADDATIIAAVEEALEQTRPRLAARLALLVTSAVAAAHPAVQRARRGLRLQVVRSSIFHEVDEDRPAARVLARFRRTVEDDDDPLPPRRRR